MKGYMFTALTVMMFLSLFTLTYYYSVKTTQITRQDINAEKTLNVFDDAADDLKRKADVSAKIADGDTVSIRFEDRIPARWDIPSSIRDWVSFLNTTYSAEANAGIELECAALSSPTSAVDFNITPYRYSYGYENLGKRTVWLRNQTTEYEPQTINLTLDFRGEGIEDIVWYEAEWFTSDGGVETQDPEASGGRYMEDFNLLSGTVNIPLSLNYTLWVRTIYDNSNKNFTVEVDGRNSSRFDIRAWGSETREYRWFNDTAVIFNLTSGDKVVKVYPDPASGTESVDVVLLTTKYLNPPNTPPLNPPNDPVETANTTGGDLEVHILVVFLNTNYTYDSNTLSRNVKSWWNFTFNDGDAVKISLGSQDTPHTSANIMKVELYDDKNQSSGILNVTATFPDTSGRVYVDSGCYMRTAGAVSRSDRLWFAKG